MGNEFFEIIDILERVKRKNPKKSFTELLYMVGVNDLDFTGSVLNNWTSSVKMKDNRSDTDREVLDRVMKFWLSNGGQRNIGLVKEKRNLWDGEKGRGGINPNFIPGILRKRKRFFDFHCQSF